MISEAQAEALLQDLVSIPSVSGQESAASRWLVDQMARLGYDRTWIDEAGNAVGAIGRPDAPKVVVLLGHIDTVPGAVAVRRETTADGACLFGRGAVDAKGPLANFALSAADARPALRPDCQLLVVGAVEEEAATSKGARAIRDRWNGQRRPIPRYCFIGEPSGFFSIVRGYKGRVLIDLDVRQPTAHTAGPGRAIAEWIVAYWRWLEARLTLHNLGRARLFNQASPSLREFSTCLWEAAHDRARCLIGIRLPRHFDVAALAQQSRQWIAAQAQADMPQDAIRIGPDQPLSFAFAGPVVAGAIRFSGFEPAWLTPRRNHLCRSLQYAIRQETGRPARFAVKTGTCDMNVVGPAWQCPVVAYGPGNSLLDHTPNEHVVLSEFHASRRILTRALRSLLAVA